MNKIIIKIIPHKKQRYDTAGDWYYKNGNLLINASLLKNRYMSMLVAFHELIEAVLCERRGIKQEEVDRWDLKNNDSDNPGGMKKAPYRKEHRFAEKLERLFAKELGINWKEYDDKIVNL